MVTRFQRAAISTLRAAMAPVKTFAFIDLETTGLPSWEQNKTKITELTILAVQSDHLELGVLPRVQNKLTLCFNPRKLISIDSERITGLSNSALEHLSPFTENTVEAINGFLRHSQAPICLVAHNGNRFDYPILRTEVHKTGANLLADILCIDSLEAFRDLDGPGEQASTPDLVPIEFRDDFDALLCRAMDEYEAGSSGTGKSLKRVLDVQKANETTPGKDNGLKKDEKKMFDSRKKLDFRVSYKLADVYQRLTNKVAENAHQAENDVNMLALCAATLGEKFVEWANAHSRQFCDTPMMVPGRKLGT